jgi:hypothetical protein
VANGKKNNIIFWNLFPIPIYNTQYLTLQVVSDNKRREPEGEKREKNHWRGG